MNKKCLPFEANGRTFMKYKDIEEIENQFDKPSLISNKNTPFQKGGNPTALRYLKSFFDERVANYSKNISKPEKSRMSCSRLSPYIAWGNISIRQVYEEAWKSSQKGLYKRQISNFASRLRWQAHFIQKFEMESDMEFISVNKGYRNLDQPVNPFYHNSWT